MCREIHNTVHEFQELQYFRFQEFQNFRLFFLHPKINLNDLSSSLQKKLYVITIYLKFPYGALLYPTNCGNKKPFTKRSNIFWCCVSISQHAYLICLDQRINHSKFLIFFYFTVKGIHLVITFCFSLFSHFVRMSGCRLRFLKESQRPLFAVRLILLIELFSQHLAHALAWE